MEHKSTGERGRIARLFSALRGVALLTTALSLAVLLPFGPLPAFEALLVSCSCFVALALAEIPRHSRRRGEEIAPEVRELAKTSTT